MGQNFAFSMLKIHQLEKSTPPPVVTYIIYVVGTSYTLYALYVLHYILLYVRIASIECNIQYKILIVEDNYAAEGIHNVTKYKIQNTREGQVCS